MVRALHQTIDRKGVKNFFDTIFPSLDGFIEIRCLPSRHQEFFEIKDDAIDHALSIRDENVYFGVNPRVRHSGKNEDAPLVYNIIADLDFKHDPQKVRDQQLEKFPLKPTAVVHSGGGYHVYWSLKEPIDADKAQSLMRRLHQHLNGDPVSDSARILRVPGTLNYKYLTPRRVRITSLEENRYTRQDFYSILPEPTPPKNDLAGGLNAGGAKFEGSNGAFTIPHGQRDNTVFSRARSLAQQGYPQEIALVTLELLNKNHCDPSLGTSPDDRSVEEIVDHAYRDYEVGEFWTSHNGSSSKNYKSSLPHMSGNVADLMKATFPPVRWAIPDILPEGLALLSAKPKHGKSLLTLGWAIAIATGGVALGCKRVEKGRVLGLLLEENPRRLQDRIRKQILGLKPDLSNFDYHLHWPRVDEGGKEKLEQYLTTHPDTSLVIIDTLKMWRSNKGSNKGIYDQDYEAMEPLRDLADKHNVSIVVVHHNNKLADAEDPFDCISGSTGLIGASNTNMVLQKVPNKSVVTMYIRGHDLEEEKKYALVYDPFTLKHNLDENPDQYETSEERQEIIDLLRQGGEWTTVEIAEFTNKTHGAARKLLASMVNDEQIHRVKDGVFSISPDGDDGDDIGSW